MSQSQISQAYGSTQKLGAEARQTEARALLEAARRMAESQKRPEDREEYRAALRLNWRLWTIIQSDIVSDENSLPSEIKANIMSLSVFIDKHTVGSLANPDAARMNVLIEINRNIASGLMTTPAPETQSGPQDSAQDVPRGNILA
ncbi:MAG: flagellar biosynthesis regulator FlaF [Alphaproteobacteria bacterium]|nr:flagellar biosynthesis regulator FlaF [Alphaproteobacteria bacterium]